MANGGTGPTGWKLERRAILLIVAFWTFLAVLSTVNRVLDPRNPGLQLIPPSAPIVLTLFESYLWALLTPGIFWLAARFNPSRPTWATRIPFLLGLGLLLGAGVNAAIDFMRYHVLGVPARFGAEPTVVYGLRHWWFVNDFIVYLGVLAAGVAREYFRRYEVRNQDAARLQAETALLRSQLAEAQLATLRMQLNPHFLFNTLHAVSALVERDPAGVRRMIARLSELLRSTLRDGEAPERTVEGETAFAARYLEIMQLRFEGKLQIEMDVDPEARHALVPTLVLQPLVENAVKHGVGRARGGGRVAVEARRLGDRIRLTVFDSGAGGDPRPSDDGGVGLRNTQERLRQMYGTEASLSLEKVDGGARATVELPYRPGAEAPVAATAYVS